jgi:hypothetical protein
MDTSLNLLPPMDETVTLVGDIMRGAGWYGHTTGLHTIAIRVMNFSGRVSVQASIAATPAAGDWYSVLPDGAAYMQYPRPGFVPSLSYSGETSVLSFNFTTNAVWLQASVDRSYLLTSFATPLQIMNYGTVSYVMVNY